MILYDKLVKKGSKVLPVKDKPDCSILRYEGTDYHFSISRDRTFGAKYEISYRLVGVSFREYKKVYEYDSHVRAYDNVILFRKVSLNDLYTETFLRSMWGKFILNSEDIRKFKKEGFRVLVEL